MRRSLRILPSRRPRTPRSPGRSSATDVDSVALTFRIVTGPLHGTLTLSGAGFVYLPALDFNGV